MVLGACSSHRFAMGRPRGADTAGIGSRPSSACRFWRAEVFIPVYREFLTWSPGDFGIFTARPTLSGRSAGRCPAIRPSTLRPHSGVHGSRRSLFGGLLFQVFRQGFYVWAGALLSALLCQQWRVWGVTPCFLVFTRSSLKAQFCCGSRLSFQASAGRDFHLYCREARRQLPQV